MGRPRPGSAELPRAARRALGRRRSRAGALPRGHVDHAAMPPLRKSCVEDPESTRVSASTLPGVTQLGVTMEEVGGPIVLDGGADPAFLCCGACRGDN